MTKRPKRPRDPNQLAKLVVDLSIGEARETNPDEGKDPSAVRRGHLGGVKGGVARAKVLTPKKRSEIAKTAAKKRWRKD